MDDVVKCATHLLDGETICCGMDVIDTIKSKTSNGGIAIINQGEKIHYTTVRYVTEIELCNCPECIATINGPIQEQQELGVITQAMINASVNYG